MTPRPPAAPAPEPTGEPGRPPEPTAEPRAGGDEEALVRDFGRRFVEVRREEIEAIPAWLDEGRFDLVARVGHQIKGTAPTFGLPEIGEAGARLEAAARGGDAQAVLAELGVLRSLMRPE